jgi:hypothetical protein
MTSTEKVAGLLRACLEKTKGKEREGVERVRAKRWVGPLLVGLGCTGMEGENREGCDGPEKKERAHGG